MKITFFIGSMVSGGAERVISLLANYYADKDYDVSIALLLENLVDYEQYSLNKNIQIVDLTVGQGSYTKNSFKWIKKIRKYLKNDRPDCIVSFIGRINALVLTSSIGFHIPTLISERNDPKRDGRNKLMQKYCSSIYKRADKVVFQTKYARDCFPHLSGKKCVVIPNPVEVDKPSNIVRNPYLITTAGRLNVVKNQKMLIDAMKIVHDQFPLAKCIIYGKGDEEKNLNQQIEELHLKNVVSLGGNKSNIGPCLCESSIFALTSQYEGMPNALIEAMMCGNACITTNYAGAEDVIEDGQNGILIELDDTDKLANSVLDLLKDEEKRNKLSQNAIESSNQYKKDKILNLWDKEICDLIPMSKESK